MIVAVIFLSVLGLILFNFYRYQSNLTKRISELPDEDPVMDEVQVETQGKYPVYIREEEREVWNKLSRKQKRHLSQKYQKMIKSGELIPIEENGITRYIRRVDRQDPPGQDL